MTTKDKKKVEMQIRTELDICESCDDKNNTKRVVDCKDIFEALYDWDVAFLGEIPLKARNSLWKIMNKLKGENQKWGQTIMQGK